MNLSNLHVLELASVLAGPSVGQFFAELGATVIKVENPHTSGDVTRSWVFKGEQPKETVSSYFSSVNWGKQSIALDITNPTGLSTLYKLVKQSDIVISSFKPGDDIKLKADYHTLKAINSSIIYGHITGYGPTNSMVGYDAVIQAESGFMSINGSPESGPLKMPVALMDILAAHHLKEGLLVALIHRMNSGEGSYVPVSLIDAAVSSLANQGTNWLVGGKVPVHKGNQHPNIAPYGDVFETQDKQKVILAVGNDKQFTALSIILGLNVHQIPEYLTNSLRIEHRPKLTRQLETAIAQVVSTDFLEKCNIQKIPVGLVKSIDTVFKNPQAHWLFDANGIQGVRTFMGMPSTLEHERTLSPPPQFSEHTEEILASLNK